MRRLPWLAALLLGVPAASGFQDIKEPRLGYCYPAGGRQGTVVQVLAGGQVLTGTRDAVVSGAGVRAKVVRYMGRPIRLNGPERKEVLRRLKDLKGEGKPSEPPKEPVKLPSHPLLNNLETLAPVELDWLVHEMLRPDEKKQQNSPVGETVLLEVTIDADAVPGDREIRLRAQLGLTNPIVFQVGRLAEHLDPKPYDEAPAAGPAVDLPATWNGQIRPGDEDAFRFRAVEGQPLVIQVQARRLVPFIADAVPGWFQAVLSLHDAEGRELAFADDYRYDPDPVVFFRVPRTGEYELRLHDSLYRGREDFVYRVHVSEQPFIKGVFPLGGREGAETLASIDGWNVLARQLPLDTRPGDEPVRQASLRDGEWTSNPVTFAVDPLPDLLEREPNDAAGSAQRIETPVVVNGRIARVGDEDAFRFEGQADAEVVVEVLARRLQSPLDSLVRLCDAAGRVLAWNDDVERKEGDLRTDMGTLTHHADSYLRFRLPKDGTYVVRISDSQRAGSDAHAYRMRIGPPRPDFSLRMTPSTLNLRPGIAALVDVYAIRLDGFDGPIALALKDAPAGFQLQGARIPAGGRHVRMTLTPPAAGFDGTRSLRIEGSAECGGRTIVRAARPCEDSMQAFLWRHLVPAQELIATMAAPGPRRSPPEFAGSLPLRIPRGGTAELRLRLDGRGKPESITFELGDAPKGVTLVETTPRRGELVLLFKADAEGAPAGTAGNLIVGVYLDPSGGKEGKGARNRRIGIGVLPAIPFEIVAAEPAK